MPAISTRLDWLSFTVDVLPLLTEGRVLSAGRVVLDLVREATGGVLTFSGGPNIGVGRYPYRFSTDGDGFKVYWSQGQPEMLIEVSGKGCEALHNSGALPGLVEAFVDRLTRVDIATDILTETRPLEFAEQRSNQRHKSHEHNVSQSGETYYVGSRKSPRYARVYRYEPPHPRADRLRVECVFRGPHSVALARTWLEVGDEETAARVGNQYGWTHPDWTPESKETIPAWRPDRSEHKTLHWYHSQVIPAVKKLIKAGVLTKEDMMQDFFPPTGSL